MDAVDRAIKNGKHFSKILQYNNQTWKQFADAAENKPIIMIGVGVLSELFWKRYEKTEQLIAIFDSDEDKDGVSGDFFIGIDSDIKLPAIQNTEKLDKLENNDLIVLVTSINYYEEIAVDLQNRGISDIFILLIMEANLRKDADYSYELTETNRLDTERIDPRKVVFESFGKYSDHGKYITEALLRYRDDLDIVWAVKSGKCNVPKGVRIVCSENRKQYLYELKTAKIVIYSNILPPDFKKNKDQIHIFTKHWASITLKRFYLDAKTLDQFSGEKKVWEECFHQLDYIFTGSKFDEDSVRRGMDFAGPVVNVGSPRSDALFQQEMYRKKIESYYHVESETHILIYAPTYRYKRDGASIQHVAETRNIDLDYQKILSAMNRKFGGTWLIFLRLHPSQAKEATNVVLPDFVKNVSDYEDSEELCAACDIMITDYSSIMFEPAFVKKPVFLFATDKKDYIDKEYDLLIDYDTLPFSIAESNTELERVILDFDQNEYENKVTSFLDQYGVHEDGHASERAAKFIMDLLVDKEK